MKTLAIFILTAFCLSAGAELRSKNAPNAMRSENERKTVAFMKQNNPENKQEITYIQVVKLKSSLPEEKVLEIMNQRKPQFLEVPGLVQKYYVKEAATGEFSGIYLWASKQDCENFLQSELGKTIAAAYQVEGKPRIEKFDMLFPLR